MSAAPARRLLTIPFVFFVDHMWRALPTPAIVRETARHYVIDADDPNLGELIDDARHYVDGVDGAPHVSAAARALLKSLSRQGVAL